MSCPFQSITRAVQYITGVFGSAVPAGTTVILTANSLNSNSSRNERFPIIVPANVIIRGAGTGPGTTIELPSGVTGFWLRSPNSTISDLLIDGKGLAAIGVSVGGIASNSTTVLTRVTIQNLQNIGVSVSSGGVALGAGVTITGNGTTASATRVGGVVVSGGNVNAAVSAGQAPIHIDANVGNGVAVVNAGSVTFAGVPDTTGFPVNPNPPAVVSGSGTITINANSLANVVVAQSGNTRPLCRFDGVVVRGSLSNGFDLASGSNVGVKNSVVVKNAASGVRITNSGNANITSTSASINLGPDSLGKNILQVNGANANAHAGICIDGRFFNVAQALQARANYFRSSDCSAPPTAPALQVQSSLNGCAGGIDVGLELTPANAQQTNIRVVLNNCQSL